MRADYDVILPLWEKVNAAPGAEFPYDAAQKIFIFAAHILFMRPEKDGTRIYLGTNPQDCIHVTQTVEEISTALCSSPKQHKSAWQKFWSSWRKQNGSERNTETG